MRPARVWRRLSLRGRLMVVGVSGLVAGLLVGGVLLVSVLGSTLHRGAEEAATKTAAGMAELIAADSLPDPLPVTGDDVRAQVIDGDGRVVAASLGADRLVPFLYPDERPARGNDEPRSVYIDGQRIGVTGPVQVVAVRAGTAEEPRTVLVAKSLGDLVRAVDLLKHSLLIAYPLLVAVARRDRLAGDRSDPAPGRDAPGGRARRSTDGARADRLPLPASRDEIHRLAVTLNGMLARLEGARARQRAFVADAAHELRSPLANLRTQLEVAQRLGEAPDAEDLLADVRRLGGLVDDLLLLARSDDLAGRPDPVTGPVDVGALLAAVAARYPARVVLRPVAGGAVDGRRRGGARPGGGQPGGQRGPARPQPGGARRDRGRRPGRDHRDRRRAGHPGGRPRAGVRPVHPARRRPGPGRRWRRARAVDRAGAGRPARRHGHPRRRGAGPAGHGAAAGRGIDGRGAAPDASDPPAQSAQPSQSAQPTHSRSVQTGLARPTTPAG